jgi:hypothetical protein
MAKKTAAAPDTSLFSATVVEEAVPMRAEKPNPLEGAYLHSYENSPDDAKEGVQLRVPAEGRVFPDEAGAKDAVALLRRAADKHDGGLRHRIVTPEDGTADENGTPGFAVYFTWHEKSARNYTADDVRAWARDNGYGDELPEKGRVPGNITRAYRIAHNLPVKAEETPAE